MDLWKESVLVDRYCKLVWNLKKKIFEYFWDNDWKVFINGIMNDNVIVDKCILYYV